MDRQAIVRRQIIPNRWRRVHHQRQVHSFHRMRVRHQYRRSPNRSKVNYFPILPAHRRRLSLRNINHTIHIRKGKVGNGHRHRRVDQCPHRHRILILIH